MIRNDKDRMVTVERLAHDLPRDIQPSTDLWPGIEARLESQSTTESAETFRWWPRAAAAAVILVTASSLATMMWLGNTVAPGPAVVVGTERPLSAGDGLRSPELLAISALSESDRDILMTNLDIVRDARASIERTMETDPFNTSLHNAWLRVYEQELDLLNVATWTTNGLAERVKT